MTLAEACAQTEEVNIRSIDIRAKRILLSEEGLIRTVARNSLPASNSILASAAYSK
jgi:hypothetical protein